MDLQVSFLITYRATKSLPIALPIEGWALVGVAGGLIKSPVAFGRSDGRASFRTMKAGIGEGS